MKHVLLLFVSLFAVLTLMAQTDTTYSARRTRSGIIVVDSGRHTRAFEPFKATTASATAYANMVKAYRRALPSQVRIYCMAIPNAVAFYCPEQYASWTNAEQPVIEQLYRQLADTAICIPVYETLAQHTDEPIYSRTDHHWAPLGAYYAAATFAQKANVSFLPLTEYQPQVVHNYVGTMYTFSKDLAVKRAPEDFVYYLPKDNSYTAQFVTYTLGKNRRTASESQPTSRPFFVPYRDGSSGAYCTFMGGDTRTVRVVTNQKNGRRLMILKDSYGNALPPFLFCAFEEIHVVDFRYFPHSITDYVADNGITDVLFANNLIHVCAQTTPRRYLEMLQHTTHAPRW